ncbi:hypothetical protein ACFYSC_04370 [Streptosporangium sp. NPDC004379]|uniref:hypothetical protein n=1 Tax=Streptosporangium sp. NPDC004379 TaxID=3366189 RepID=UPI00369A4796
MLSVVPGPHDPRSPERPPDDGAGDDAIPGGGPRRPEDYPPTLRHFPPGPSDDGPRGVPLASPWMLPPFSAPVPEEDEPLRARPEGLGGERRRPHTRPYSSSRDGLPEDSAPGDLVPEGRDRDRDRDRERDRDRDRDRDREQDGDAAPRPAPRRAVRPDMLVASGPPRVPGGAPGFEAPGADAVPDDDDFEPVRRVGRPPGGRPARPDLLVAQGPPGRRGPAGGRHHRSSPPPSAVRRSSPTRRRSVRGLVVPVAVVMVLAVAVAGGLALWGWVGDPFGTGLRLVGDESGSGDSAFVAQPEAGGTGSSQVLNAMAADGSTVVAVGSDTTSPVPRPLFLVSTDGGSTWRLGRVNGPAGFQGGPTAVGAVAGGDGRWLAAGNDLLGTGQGLWTSADGYEWTAVDPAGTGAFVTGDKIMELARTSSGFVAVGTAVLPDGTAGAVAWVSPDGRGWSRVDTSKIGAPDRVRGLKAVVARGEAVVALGDPGQGRSSSVILRSADGGRTWLRTGTELDGVIPEPGTLAASAGGFVLVPAQQRGEKGDVQVRCSSQGDDWNRCGKITGMDPDGTGVRRLTSSPQGVAAIAETAFERYAVYTSKDGHDWARSTDLGQVPGSLRAVTVSGTGTLVVGGDERAADVDNRLVLITAPRGGRAAPVPLGGIEGLARAERETARVAAGEGGFVAVGTASGDAGVWTSADGQSWTAAGPAQALGGPRRQSLADVAQGRHGWLAVGGTMTDASSTEPLLLTSAGGPSAGGANWRRVPIAGPLAPAADHDFLAPHAVAAGPSGYVLAGEDRGPAGSVPVLWFTPDLKRYTRAEKLPAGGSGVRLHDVSATSTGYVAVGGAGTAGHETGVVWVSADGVAWTARKPFLPPGATSAGLRHVVLHGGSIVATGSARTDQGDRPFGAVSADNGTTWRVSWLPAGRAAAVQDLAATDDGVVAVGWDGVPGDGDSAVWTSEDGATWLRHDPEQGNQSGEGAQWLGAVAIAGDRVVALGRSTTYDADHLTVWRSTLAPER